MISLSDPPCLIEHELYDENAIWILPTLSTRECSSNERLRPRWKGGTLIFSYIRRLRPFFGLKILNFNIVLVYIKMNIFGGIMNIFGVLEIPDIFGGVSGRCGARAYV